MNFIVLNNNERRIQDLKGILEPPSQISVLNGEDILKIKTSQGGHLQKNYRVLYKMPHQNYWHEYIIKEIVETRNANTIEWSLHLESSFYETWGDYIQEYRIRDKSARYALERALTPTRWSVGHVDDLGEGTVTFYRMSARAAVSEIIKEWGGEIQTRVMVSGNTITHRYVDIYQKLGKNRGKRFTYYSNLESITKTIISEDIYTAVYGYGKGEQIDDGYGRRITFGDVNDGKNYLENLEILQQWGRVNSDGTKSHVFGHVEFDDCEDPSELKILTQEYLDSVSQPQISYEVDVSFIGDVELGDVITIIDKDYVPELRIQARVIQIDTDLLNSENSKITLGNYKPNIASENVKQESILNYVRDKVGVWDRSNILDKDGISVDYIKNLLDGWNSELNSTGGNVYAPPGMGIITYDKPEDQNPTKAIQIIGGAFRIANRKLENGEWDWTTIGTGDGFIAENLFSDSISSNLIRVESSSGSLTNEINNINNAIENIDIDLDTRNLAIETSNNWKNISNMELGEDEEVIFLKLADVLTEGLEAGDDLTFSFDYYFYDIVSSNEEYVTAVIHAPGNFTGDGEGALVLSNSELLLNNPESVAEFGKFEETITITEEHITNSLWGVELIFNNMTSGVFSFKNLMVQKGSKRTTWQPAPEDVNKNFESIIASMDSTAILVNDILNQNGIISPIEQMNVETLIHQIENDVAVVNVKLGDVYELYPEIPDLDNLLTTLAEKSNNILDILRAIPQDGATYAEIDSSEFKILYYEYYEMLKQADVIASQVVTDNYTVIEAGQVEIGTRIGKYEEQLSLESDLISFYVDKGFGLEQAMTLAKDELAFYINTNKEVWIGLNGLNAKTATIENSARIGNHEFQKSGTDYTTINWVGG